MRAHQASSFFTFLLILLCWSTPTVAQSPIDTSYTLQEVELNAPSIRTTEIGTISQSWNTQQDGPFPLQTLSDFLATESGIYIKNYGPGSLATSSIRGGSAGHTQVIWNGFPIQSPMLGLLDLSLLPVQAASGVQLSRGGQAALWGSGAIGGSIRLENRPDFANQFGIRSQLQLGNFGHIQQLLGLQFSSAKWHSSTSLQYVQAENDFPYQPAPGLADINQSNAAVRQALFLQDLYWKASEKQQLSFHFWRQVSDREIPPTIVQNQSLARQDDRATRLIIQYQHQGKRAIWKAKAGLFAEQLDYFDDLILLESKSHFRTFLAEGTAQFPFSRRHRLLAGATYNHTQAWSPGYRETNPSEYRAALFVSWRSEFTKWAWQGSLRQELVDGKPVPFIPALGFSWTLLPEGILRGRVSRNYRLPTLNDRFWIPGGKSDLLPESGWSQELSFSQRLQRSPFSLKTSLSAYNRLINNWILWSIREGDFFWSADNIAQVWSRGLEWRCTLSYRFDHFEAGLNGGYDYIRSTNQIEIQSPKLEAGAQLLYTPVHQAYGTAYATWKGLKLSYNHRFTGAATGANGPIDAFATGHLRLQFQKSLARFSGTFFFNIENLWDKDYFIIERRPMPGRYFQCGIQLQFQKQKT